jgi:transposase
MSDKQVEQIPDIKVPTKLRKPGRPRAISSELESVVIELYHRGYGYRAISNILREEFHSNPHYSSVRLALKRLGLLPAYPEQP